MTDAEHPLPEKPPETGDNDRPAAAPPARKKYEWGKSEHESDEPDSKIAASRAPVPGAIGRTSEQQLLAYRPLERSPDRPRRRHPVRVADRLDFLRKRLEEILAKDENEPIVIMAVRSETGIPFEIVAACGQVKVHARSKGSAWAPLKTISFELLLKSFKASASDEANIVFVDTIPYSERSGDIGRLIDDVYDEHVQGFEARLKEEGFRFCLVVVIDGNESTSRVLKRNPGIRYLPWTDLWLSKFLEANDAFSEDELFEQVGDALRTAADWRDSKDDNSERKLSVALRGVAAERYETETKAIEAIQTAIRPARSGGARRETSTKATEADFDAEAEEIKLYRDKLSEFLAPAQPGSADPIKTVMLVIAAFAGGTRVDDYYSVCRMLLPNGPAETMRLPSALREIVFREAEAAERLNRERPALPGWDLVFDSECDASLKTLEIHVRAGQAIELDGKWKMIDLKNEIARRYPGVINEIMRRIREKRLFLILPEAASELLIDVVCAIREACGEGFSDFHLAHALTGVEVGLGDLGTPLDIVARLYPGLDPKLVLDLINDMQNERLTSAFDSRQESDPELARFLHRLEITPENLAAKLDRERSRLREESVVRLTRRLLRMHLASEASENGRPIVSSMLDILDKLLSSETYVAMLTYMIASSDKVDVVDIGRRLQSEFAEAPEDDIDDIVIAIHSRLRIALGWTNAPHTNWLIAFDPIRKGKPPDDRLRALAVLLWDLIVNYDVPRRIAPYERMRHLRIADRLFGRSGDAVAPASDHRAAEPDPGDDALQARIVEGFLARDPEDWLQALRALEDLFYHRFDLVRNVRDRIQDTVWAILTGVPEEGVEALERKSDRLARDVLLTLVDKLDLGLVRDFDAAAERVVKVLEMPKGRGDRRWLKLYALFWPAMIAHWRLAAFGLDQLEPGSPADERFRDFLSRVVDAAPLRMHELRDGFGALAAAAETCAQHADDMQLPDCAASYRKKKLRLTGLSLFFARHARDLPVKRSREAGG
jgi:hypothetical protein